MALDTEIPSSVQRKAEELEYDISVFELFSIGIGPSSSHTVGPMRASNRFIAELIDNNLLADISRIHIDLYGSLAATGAGHGTMSAALKGLCGFVPETISIADAEAMMERNSVDGTLPLAGYPSSMFSAQAPGGEEGKVYGPVLHYKETDMTLRPLTVLPRHTNGMKVTAFTERNGAEEVLLERTYFSIGGGFIVEGDEEAAGGVSLAHPPYPFGSGAELLSMANEAGLSIAGLKMANELSIRSEQEIREGILHIYRVMKECIGSSLSRVGYLPGPLKVRCRAGAWHRDLMVEDPNKSPEYAIDWVNLMALAVNEENAFGGRVVTAPTNGASGIIPAVLHYAMNYTPNIRHCGAKAREDKVVEFFLAAASIGALYKKRASISGAEVGCQGEVGTASSMAAAGLAQVLGGTNEQIENAAEIAMEHNLGLTCDPVGGLVQIPCIERNAMAASNAVTAARMALRGDGIHRVSLDQVIETMRQTGMDMSHRYKETSMGGLAVNVVEC
ncbi:MAG: L-serine ammonia-lyase [Rothia sp. (in: high G+C Gram-positive bacteria)]|uniref:L-serine ammonia-lyase n=1 Tax=Rothia sp. (in: high G+C Gram-positive bacteria) TaxID=1885016 RepID=UPI0026DF266C|nr:L-serine ammonia-lyase [Rothia sp. (in: high G+C Gram-positive bacteria)]MDO5749938.1 L-serine ammonia-lyase [Rothia sp. (in: high G+C Gram-positive bacteria)]